MVVLGISAAMLAGCGYVTVNNGSSNGVAPSSRGNAFAPVTPSNMAAPDPYEGAAPPAAAAGNGAGMSVTAEQRAGFIEECSGDMRRTTPPGTDVAALCGCAVDRHIAGSSQGEAVRECATQMGIAPPRN